MLTKVQLGLFRWTNYKFSTFENGRLTSLYFEDHQGNQGRWRREHPGGALLVYQGKSLRLFVAPEERCNYDFAREATWQSLPKAERPPFGNRAYGDYKVLLKGIQVNNISRSPTEGWHVLELCPPTYYPRHGSSGSVLLNDSNAGAADFKVITEITQASDWT